MSPLAEACRSIRRAGTLALPCNGLSSVMGLVDEVCVVLGICAEGGEGLAKTRGGGTENSRFS